MLSSSYVYKNPFKMTTTWLSANFFWQPLYTGIWVRWKYPFKCTCMYVLCIWTIKIKKKITKKKLKFREFLTVYFITFFENSDNSRHSILSLFFGPLVISVNSWKKICEINPRTLKSSILISQWDQFRIKPEGKWIYLIHFPSDAYWIHVKNLI